MSSVAKCLYNDAATLVRESIDGYLLTRPDLTRLDSYNTGTKVILRKVRDVNKVAVISGGGAGHEPAHGGLVAEGMLTAAISGEIFASPSMAAVLDAIRACCNPRNLPASEVKCAGAVLIVKNYTGDRLAFGLAAQKARFEGIPVELVFVDDDAAVHGGPVTGRRGIAGVSLVHKIAGAVAEAGGSLSAVAGAASLAASLLASAGASMTACSIPGQTLSDRFSGAVELEVGLGIHGEPGAEQSTMLRSHDLAERLLNIILPHLQAKFETKFAGEKADANQKPVEVALLVNNLGGMSVLEANAFLHTVVRLLHSTQQTSVSLPSVPGLDASSLYTTSFPVLVTHVLCAPLVTSLDMKGLSITLLPLSLPGGDPISLPVSVGTDICTLQQAFCAPTTCPHWPVVALNDHENCGKGVTFVPDAYRAPAAEEEVTVVADASALNGGLTIPLEAFVAVTKAMHSAIKEAEETISQLDKVAGDGDAGFTHVQVFHAIEKYASDLATKFNASTTGASASLIPLAPILANLANAVSQSAGGTSGVLYAIALQAAANIVRESNPSSAPLLLFARAFDGAISECSRLGGAKEGHRTLLDALLPAARVLTAHAEKTTTGPASVKQAIMEAAQAAEEGAVKTATLTPQVGRASYVQPQHAIGHKDPGAVAVAVWLNAMARVI